MACLIWVAVPDLGFLDNGLPDLPDLVVSSPALAGARSDTSRIPDSQIHALREIELYLRRDKNGFWPNSSIRLE